jgi:hypothetical protein
MRLQTEQVRFTGDRVRMSDHEHYFSKKVLLRRERTRKTNVMPRKTRLQG